MRAATLLPVFIEQPQWTFRLFG